MDDDGDHATTGKMHRMRGKLSGHADVPQAAMEKDDQPAWRPRFGAPWGKKQWAANWASSTVR